MVLVFMVSLQLLRPALNPGEHALGFIRRHELHFNNSSCAGPVFNTDGNKF